MQRLSNEGMKLAWFGVLITTLGLLLPDQRWVSFFGIGGTVVGLILRHRSEHLKALDEAPRTLSAGQERLILATLSDVPKKPMTVGFFGQDTEAEQFAVQIKALLERAGFQVVRLEGFLVLKPEHGLGIITYNDDANNPTASGISDAFEKAGMEVTLTSIPSRMDPAISLNVHKKPPTGFRKGLVPTART